MSIIKTGERFVVYSTNYNIEKIIWFVIFWSWNFQTKIYPPYLWFYLGPVHNLISRSHNLHFWVRCCFHANSFCSSIILAFIFWHLIIYIYIYGYHWKFMLKKAKNSLKYSIIYLGIHVFFDFDLEWVKIPLVCK